MVKYSWCAQIKTHHVFTSTFWMCNGAKETAALSRCLQRRIKNTCRTSVRFDDSISCRWRTAFRSGLLFGCPCRASLLTPNGCWETLHSLRGAETPASQHQDKELLPSLHYFLVYMTSISVILPHFWFCFHRSVINLIGLSCVPP